MKGRGRRNFEPKFLRQVANLQSVAVYSIRHRDSVTRQLGLDRDYAPVYFSISGCVERNAEIRSGSALICHFGVAEFL